MDVISGRPSRESARAERTRARLLDSTRVLIAERGAFAALSIAEIAAASGVSRPTFYAYFRDKRDLVLALGAEMERDIRAVADPWLAGEDVPLEQTLEGVLAGFRRHGPAVEAIVEASAYDVDVAAFWRAFHQWFVESGTRRALTADPEIGEEGARAAAFALVWMTERSFTEHLAVPQVGDAALISAVAGLWRSVISPEEPARADPG